MGALFLNRVDLVLFETHAGSRSSREDLLRRKGFQRTISVNCLDDLRKLTDRSTIDLLIMGIDDGDESACELVHETRHGHLGRNPYVTVVSLVREAKSGLVRRIVDAGSDALLTQAAQPKELLDRLMHLIHRRKPFVVTSDYIGPDRRNVMRPDRESVPQIHVPNALREKSVNCVDTATIDKMIQRTNGVVNERKMISHVTTIRRLVTQLIKMSDRPDLTADRQALSDHLLTVGQDLASRLVGTRLAHVGDLCDSLVTVTGAVHRKADTPDAKDLALLEELGSALHVSVFPKDSVAALSVDVAETVRAARRYQA